MASVLRPERILAGDVAVGDRICRTKRGTFEEVISVIPNERSVWIMTATRNPAGEKVGMYRIRPRPDIKLWVLR